MIIINFILMIAIAFAIKEYLKLEKRLIIKQTEIKHLRRVLYENGLIPEKFIK